MRNFRNINYLHVSYITIAVQFFHTELLGFGDSAVYFISRTWILPSFSLRKSFTFFSNASISGVLSMNNLICVIISCRLPIHREVLLLFCYSMLYDYETNLLIPKSIVILTDDLAGGIFNLKRFHGAGGEEVLDEFSDGIYEVIFIFYFRETFYLIIGGII